MFEDIEELSNDPSLRRSLENFQELEESSYEMFEDIEELSNDPNLRRDSSKTLQDMKFSEKLVMKISSSGVLMVDLPDRCSDLD